MGVISTVAEAEDDGCGRGWYYDGRGCVPLNQPGDYYPPPARLLPTATSRVLPTATSRVLRATTNIEPTRTCLTSSRISENGGETGSGAPWLSRNHAQPARRYVPGHDQAERTTWFRGQHGRKARPAYVRLEAQSVFLPYQLNIALRRSQPRFRLFGTSRLRLQSEHA